MRDGFVTPGASASPVRLAEIRSVPLRPAKTSQEFELHRAALEWSLAEPIVIHDARDVKSKLRWEDRVQPFRHQMQNLFTFCRRLPVALVADDVGLGKTISAGLILSELMIRRRVRRALVLCPSILGPQWVEELEGKFGIAARCGVGAELDSLVRGDTQVVVTTYESARNRILEIPPDTFDFLVLDEAHKLRNLYGSPSPPLGPQRIRQALESRLFRYVLMLTATPIQNRLWDIYSLVDCLTAAKGHRNPFGGPDEFRRRFIADGATARRLVDGRAEEFRAVLRQYLVRTRRRDADLPFPERGVRTLPLRMSRMEQELFKIVTDVVQGLNALSQSSILQALVSSPQALTAQLENMAEQGTIPRDAARRARGLVAGGGPCAKLDGLRRIIARLQMERPEDWRVLIFTSRRETQGMIADWLDEQGIPYGLIRGGDRGGRQKAIEGFRMDPPRFHVVVSTDSGAEGVNLQSGNVLVNFDLPWNPMVVEQRIGRIQRLGSRHATVEVNNLVLAGTYEEHIVGVLMEKLQVIAHTIGDVELLLETTDMADSGSFEAQIRQMVLASLRGQDRGSAARLHAQSIDEARDLLESQRDELETTLGRLDDLHHAGRPMPRLDPLRPSLPADDFARAALTAMGGKLRQLREGLWELHSPGRPVRRVAFEEAVARDHADGAVFMGNAPMLFQPGSRDFERLTQHWCENYAADVELPPPVDEDRLQAHGRTYCRSIDGATVSSITTSSAGGRFQGEVICRARVGNGVDSYETLIHVPVEGDLSGAEAEEASRSRMHSEIDPLQVFPQLKERVADAVRSNRGVRLFFEHYDARLREELAKAAGDPSREERLRQDLQPLAFAEIVGIRGNASARPLIDVEFALDGGSYSVRLEATSDLQGLVDPPVLEPCEETQRRVPAPFLARCEVTGKRVLRTLLRPSGASGRLALPSALVRCEETGQPLLPSEGARCEVSGKFVTRELLALSGVSGKSALHRLMTKCEVSDTRALPDELEKCSLTGLVVLPELLETCSHSGKRALKGQMICSEASGAYVLSEHAVKSSLSDRPCAPAELVTCEWSGRTALPDEVANCKLTQLKVALPHLDSRRGCLTPLSRLLQNTGLGVEDRPLARVLRDQDPRLAKLSTLYVTDEGRFLACCGRTAGILGLKVRWFAFVVDQEQRVVGSVAECQRSRDGRWHAVARL